MKGEMRSQSTVHRGDVISTPVAAVGRSLRSTVVLAAHFILVNNVLVCCECEDAPSALFRL